MATPSQETPDRCSVKPPIPSGPRPMPESLLMTSPTVAHSALLDATTDGCSPLRVPLISRGSGTSDRDEGGLAASVTAKVELRVAGPQSRGLPHNDCLTQKARPRDAHCAICWWQTGLGAGGPLPKSTDPFAKAAPSGYGSAAGAMGQGTLAACPGRVYMCDMAETAGVLGVWFHAPHRQYPI